METEKIEIHLLLEAIRLQYGYDFRDYSRAHVARRIRRHLVRKGYGGISELTGRILHDTKAFEQLLLEFSVNVTSMFRDPGFFAALRRDVLPLLKTYPFVRVWVAGCATGEEVYSLAILLREEGLYDRVQIYATDYNEVVLDQAREGIYPVDMVREYTANYQKAGGQASFADYYLARYESVQIDPSLKQKIVFADHNLVSDSRFAEMQLILCRNVLIYFNRDLQARVIGLFADSLCSGGFLCLGPKESLRFSDQGGIFAQLGREEKIFQKKYEKNG